MKSPPIVLLIRLSLQLLPFIDYRGCCYWVQHEVEIDYFGCAV